MPTLNLFPARVAIGTVQSNGDVLMTPEFFRALSDLLQRVGGATATNADEMEALFSMESSDPGAAAASEAAANAMLSSIFEVQPQPACCINEQIFNDGKDAVIASLVSRIDALEVQLAAQTEALAAASQALAYAQYAEVENIFSPSPVDWEHPGKIGAKTANSGAFTTFGCNGKAPQAAFALGAAATDLPTVITLANNLRTMSINNGIGS